MLSPMPSSGLQGNVLLTIVISNFPITYSTEDLTINFANTLAKAKKLVLGSRERTKIVMIVPAGSPGIVNVTVTHWQATSNPAFFDFEYIDDQ